MADEKFIQIGVTALRSPSGEFLPSIPLYIKAEDAGEINPHTGRTVAEDAALGDVAKVFADKFKQYKEGTKKLKAGKTAKNAEEV
jgi:hypothetical protein